VYRRPHRTLVGGLTTRCWGNFKTRKTPAPQFWGVGTADRWSAGQSFRSHRLTSRVTRHRRIQAIKADARSPTAFGPRCHGGGAVPAIWEIRSPAPKVSLQLQNAARRELEALRGFNPAFPAWPGISIGRGLDDRYKHYFRSNVAGVRGWVVGRPESPLQEEARASEIGRVAGLSRENNLAPSGRCRRRNTRSTKSRAKRRSARPFD
jgi:hypothetical protein